MGMSSGKVLRWRQRHDASVIQIDDDDAYVVTDNDKLTVLEPSTGFCPISINEVSRQYLVVCIRP